MQVLVVRHGIAMDREDAAALGITDADRPLTPRGEKRTRSACEGLACLVPELAGILTSPYRRAVGTAALLRGEYRGAATEETDALLPDTDPEELCRVLAARLTPGVMAVVGHEPHLGRFLAYCVIPGSLEPRALALLDGALESPFELKKSGAALLHFRGPPAAGSGRLAWFLPPRVLRRLRGES